LPKRSVVIAGQKWELFVTILRATVGGIIRLNRIFFRLDDLVEFFALSFFAVIFQI